MDPITASLLATGTAAAVRGGAKAIKGQKDRDVAPMKKQKQMLRDQIEQMEAGELGLTEAQRQQQIQEQTTAAGVQQAAAQSQIARDALAGQDFQQGAFADAQQRVAEGAQQAAADASKQATSVSQALRERQQQQIQADIAARAQRKRDTMNFWRDVGLEAAGAGQVAIADRAGAKVGPSGYANMSKDLTKEEDKDPLDNAGDVDSKPEDEK